MQLPSYTPVISVDGWFSSVLHFLPANGPHNTFFLLAEHGQKWLIVEQVAQVEALGLHKASYLPSGCGSQ